MGWNCVMSASDTCMIDPAETNMLEQTLSLKLLPLIQGAERTGRSSDLHFFKCTKFLQDLLLSPSSTSPTLLLEPLRGSVLPEPL